MFLCTQNVDELHEQAGSRCAVHMHGELFKSRCEYWGDSCGEQPFPDRNTYQAPVQIPTCGCGGKIRPHIVWFGEQPFEMDRILQAAERCTIFVAIGTSGVVEPAASLVRLARRRQRAQAVYVGPEKPTNSAEFDRCVLGNGGDVVPGLFQVE
jgi:NAD-dependent deacetylase